MRNLPTGIVTFVLTDIEGSTRYWQQYPDAMPEAVACHNRIAERIVEEHHGFLLKKQGEGDSLFIVFDSPTEAVAAACTLQQTFLATAWPGGIPMKVRMALHTGEAQLRDGDYFGMPPTYGARLRSIAHGGQILVSQATQEMARLNLPHGVTLRPLGSHFLRDLRPEPVSQLDHPDLPADFPPLRALRNHNLPHQVTSFIGRKQELEAIRGLLLAGPGMLTLTGIGGGGKTRLALQTAADVLEHFDDGVWMVDISRSNAENVVTTIAAALGVQEEPTRPLSEALANALRQRSLMVVLDNCEHIQEACARIALNLLKTCPRLTLLATSRVPLQIQGERIWPVPTFAVPDTERLPPLDELRTNESVALFLERARAVKPRFDLTAENAGDVVQICRRLAGIPLALELAAVHVTDMSPAEIVAGLDDCFSLLEDESPVPLERHQTLRAAIDWSYRLLKPEEQRLFRQLSVFVGGWTLRAAARVCSGPMAEIAGVRKQLRRLVLASLILAEEREQETRYRLLEPLRQYGLNLLAEQGETESVQNRHLACFLEMAEEAAPHLTGKDQALWLRRLETDHDNLRAALTWAVNPETRLRLAGALCRFWTMRGHLQEGRGWLENALARGRECDPSLRAKALTGLGALILRQGNYAAALRSLEEAQAICSVIGDPSGLADIYNTRGTIASAQGRLAEAHSYFEQSLELHRQRGDRWGIAAVLNNLGAVAIRLDNNDQAQTYYEESLTLYRTLEDAANITILLCNLGMVCYAQGDYVRTSEVFEEGIAQLRESGNLWTLAVVLGNQATTLIHRGDFRRAQADAFESLRLLRELQDQSNLVFPLKVLAQVAQADGKPECAVRLIAGRTVILQEGGTQMPPSDEAEIEALLQSLRELLGEETFRAFWEEGLRMPRAALLDYALLGAD